MVSNLLREAATARDPTEVAQDSAMVQQNLAMVQQNLAKIKMTVTPWRRDERGNRWREVYRAEDA